MTRPVLPRTYGYDLSMASIASMESRRSVSVAYQATVAGGAPAGAKRLAGVWTVFGRDRSRARPVCGPSRWDGRRRPAARPWFTGRASYSSFCSL